MTPRSGTVRSKRRRPGAAPRQPRGATMPRIPTGKTGEMGRLYSAADYYKLWKRNQKREASAKKAYQQSKPVSKGQPGWGEREHARQDWVRKATESVRLYDLYTRTQRKEDRKARQGRIDKARRAEERARIPPGMLPPKSVPSKPGPLTEAATPPVRDEPLRGDESPREEALIALGKPQYPIYQGRRAKPGPTKFLGGLAGRFPPPAKPKKRKVVRRGGRFVDVYVPRDAEGRPPTKITTPPVRKVVRRGGRFVDLNMPQTRFIGGIGRYFGKGAGGKADAGGRRKRGIRRKKSARGEMERFLGRDLKSKVAPFGSRRRFNFGSFGYRAPTGGQLRRRQALAGALAEREGEALREARGKISQSFVGRGLYNTTRRVAMGKKKQRDIGDVFDLYRHGDVEIDPELVPPRLLARHGDPNAFGGLPHKPQRYAKRSKRQRRI